MNTLKFLLFLYAIRFTQSFEERRGLDPSHSESSPGSVSADSDESQLSQYRLISRREKTKKAKRIKLTKRTNWKKRTKRG